MAIAGTLEIQLLANMARLQSDMNQAKGIVGGAMQGIQSAATTAMRALGAIGVGLSIAGLLSLTKSTIDAIARMKDLGQEAGTTASAISKFDAPARMASLGLDSVAAAMFKMSKAALEAKDPTSNAAKALASIGISANQLKGLKPDQMFELIARSVSKYSDGLEKNAVMQELFSKSGREMNKVMAEIASTGSLVSTVTDEQAEAADRLQDQMVELQMNSEKFWRSLISDGVPALNDILKAFIDARREGSLLDGVIGALSTTFDKLGRTSPNDRLKEVNDQIRISRETAEKLQREGTTFLGIERTGEIAQAAKLNELLRVRAGIEKEIHDSELAAQNRRAEANRGGKGAPNYDPAKIKEAAKATKELGDANAHVVLWMKQMADLQDSVAKGIADGAESFRLQIDAIDKLTERVLFENETRGMTRSGIEAVIIARLEEQQAILRASGAMEQDIELLQKEIDARKRLRDAIGTGEQAERAERSLREQNEQYSLMSGYIDGLADSLMDGVGSALDYVKRLAKQFAAEMLSAFAKKYLLQIGVGGSGGAGGMGGNPFGSGFSFGGNTWGGSAAGTGIYGPMQNGGNLAGSGFFSSSGVSMFGGNASAGGMMGGAGMGYGVGSTAHSLFGNERNQTGMTAGGTIGGMIGSIWGPIGAMVGSMIGSAIGSLIKSGGGPKVSGSYTALYDANGMIRTAGAPGTDNGRWFTSGEQDSQARALADATASSFFKMLRAFGGSSGNVAFGFGTDMDPKGTAQSRVSASAVGADGRVLYRQQNLEAGRSEAEMEAALKLESSRAILAALQASDLPDEIAEILNAVTVSTADQAAIDRALEAAAVMRTVLDVIGAMALTGLDATTFKQLARDNETLADTAERVASQWTFFVQNFTTEAEALAVATTDVNDAFTAMGIAVPASREEFAALVRGLDLSTEAGRSMFNALMDVAPAFGFVADAAAQATAAARSMMEEFDGLMGRLRPGYTAQRQGLQLSGDLSTFMAGNAWTNGMTAEQVLEQIRTITREDFSRYDATTQRLILSILGLDDTMAGVKETFTDLSAYNGNPFEQGKGLFEAFGSKYGDLLQGQGSRAERLSMQSQFGATQIAQWQAQQQALQGQFGPGATSRTEYLALENAILRMREAMGGWGEDAARLAILTAQYGAAAGEQLLDLEKWYAAQRTLLGDNLDAILALEELYARRRGEIIAGSLSEEARAREQLGKWIDSVLLNTQISPLTLQQRLAEAKRQYEEQLLLAQGGDVNAISGLGNSAEAYLRLARELGASSGFFNEIWRTVLGQTGGVAGLTQAEVNSRLHNALPTSGTLATSANIESLETRIAELTTVLLERGIATTDAGVAQRLDTTNRQLQQNAGALGVPD